jgi:hypothetical protein
MLGKIIIEEDIPLVNPFTQNLAALVLLSFTLSFCFLIFVLSFILTFKGILQGT